MSISAPAASDRQSPVEAALRMVNRRPRLWLTLLALLLAAQIRPWWFPQGDGMSFLSMARSLALEGQMRNLGRAHLWYFPGYSLLLSPLYLIAERPFWLISAFQWLSAIAFMIGVYWWAQSVLPQWAVWIAGLCVVNQGVWIHCARTMNEVPFMCGWIWSANVALAAARSATWRRTLSLGSIAAMLLVLTALIRPAGILLAAGLGLHLGWLALRKHTTWTRAVALTLLVGVPGSLAIVGFLRLDRSTASEEHARTYLDNFGDSAASPLTAYVEGARMAIRDSGRVIIPGMFKAYQERGWRDFNLLVYFPACVVLAAGWWKLTRETADPLLLSTPVYVLLYVVYPYEAGARFYIPLLPVFMASFVRLVTLLPRGRYSVVSAVVCAHLLLAVGYWFTVDTTRGRAATARWDEIDPIAKAIDCHKECVVAWKVSGDDVFMLELVLDRFVPKTGIEALSPNVDWIVAKRNAPVVPRFDRCLETDSLCLLKRLKLDGQQAASDNRSAR